MRKTCVHKFQARLKAHLLFWKGAITQISCCACCSLSRFKDVNYLEIFSKFSIIIQYIFTAIILFRLDFISTKALSKTFIIRNRFWKKSCCNQYQFWYGKQIPKFSFSTGEVSLKNTLYIRKYFQQKDEFVENNKKFIICLKLKPKQNFFYSKLSHM